MAGGLFRYADYGFQTEEEFQEQDPEGWDLAKGRRKDAWSFVVQNFSALEDLLRDRDNELYPVD